LQNFLGCEKWFDHTVITIRDDFASGFGGGWLKWHRAAGYLQQGKKSSLKVILESSSFTKHYETVFVN